LLQNWPLQWPPQIKMSGSAPAERGLAFGDDENVGSPRKFFQNFLNLFQAYIKKKKTRCF